MNIELENCDVNGDGKALRFPISEDLLITGCQISWCPETGQWVISPKEKRAHP